MKILYSTDAHFKKRGSMTNESRAVDNPYGSARLDSLVKTYQYKYKLAVEYGVDMIINGGDLIDKPLISSEEAHALRDAITNHPDIQEYILVGNHDSKGEGNNVTTILGNHPYIKVVDKPTRVNNHVSLLPYTTDYLMDLSELSGTYLFSHIDLIGTHFGFGHFSEVGFDPAVLATTFAGVINGHIHHASDLSKGFNNYPNVFNGGAVTGTGLGDHYSRAPGFLLIDTELGSITPIDNPYAILYYTIKVSSVDELSRGVYDLLHNSGEYYGMHLRVVVPESIKSESRMMLDSVLEHEGSNILGSTLASQLSRRVQSEETDEAEEFLDIESSMSVAELLLGYIESVDVKSLPTDEMSMTSFIVNTYGGEES